MRPNLKRGLFPVGIKPTCRINWCRTKEYVAGAYTTANGFVWSHLEKINSDNIIGFIHEVISKHIRDFILIIDNAPWHKSRKISGFLDELSDCVKILRLPRYSPEDDPVEQYWRVSKQNMANRLFEKPEDFRDAVHKELDNTIVRINMSNYLGD